MQEAMILSFCQAFVALLLRFAACTQTVEYIAFDAAVLYDLTISDPPNYRQVMLSG